MKRVKLKYIFIAIGIVTILYVGYRVVASLVLTGTFEKKYTRKDVIDNYFNREKEITDLVNSFTAVVPDVKTNKGVSFGLGDNHNKFSLGFFLLDGSVLENNPNIGGNNLKLNSAKSDTLLTMLKWQKKTVLELKEKLEKANCSNISSKDEQSIIIDFKYSNWGLYSYQIFNRPLSDSLINWYNNNKGDTVIRNNVVVRYSSAL